MVTYLPEKHGMNSVPRLHVKKPGIVAPPGTPAIGGAVDRWSVGSLASQPCLIAEFQVTGRLCLKKIRWTAVE